LKDFEKRLQDENEKANYTKREVGQWEKERQKLEGFYGGIVSMTKPADAIFIIDTHLEDLAVREAIAMNVKTVGITDTNSDPTIIDYPIPANDDAVGSIKLITQYILDAWKEGKIQESRIKNQESKKDKEGASASVSTGSGQDKVKKEEVKEKEEKKHEEVQKESKEIISTKEPKAKSIIKKQEKKEKTVEKKELKKKISKKIEEK
jgi:small subunit ribosomal protein S2